MVTLRYPKLSVYNPIPHAKLEVAIIVDGDTGHEMERA